MQNMKPPQECVSLDEIRLHIDKLDTEIIALFGKRFQYVKEVVKFKSNKTEVIARERYNKVLSSRREMAVANGLSPEVIEKIYRTLLGYFIEEETRILEGTKGEKS
jgi:isochorismate pyruvate lyase